MTTETTEQRRRRTHKRTGLVLHEVSLVDKGACPGARVALCKRDDGADATTSATKRQEMHRRMDAVQAQIDALTKRDSTMPVSDLSKSENAEHQLRTLAKRRSEESGESYARAYTEVLKTDEGQRLYAEHADARDRHLEKRGNVAEPLA